MLYTASNTYFDDDGDGGDDGGDNDDEADGGGEVRNKIVLIIMIMWLWQYNSEMIDPNLTRFFLECFFFFSNRYVSNPSGTSQPYGDEG